MNKEDLDVIIHESKGNIADKESDLNLDGGYFKCQSKVCYLSISNYHKQAIPVCELDEFQQRALELGYVNGYRWGVEYQANGEKPDLDSSILVYVVDSRAKYSKEALVIDVHWPRYDTFEIVDERYKPADTGYLENNNLTQVDDTNVAESDWYDYDNQKAISLPPVDYECEFSDSDFIGWRKCKYIGINSVGSKRFAVIFDSVKKDYINNWIAGDLKFRPLDWNRKAEAEKKRVVDAARNFLGAMLPQLEALYDAGYLKLPE
ncbi:MAG: hypothetical protein [Podoviridae sp. ctKoA10]|nr:MAG: hypothetical protein [Podoviridae sp. ctKoA10]